MPTFARSETGKWHVVGADGCRYGRSFAGDAEPADRLTETDIVAYEPPSTPDDLEGAAVGRHGVLGRTDEQRLVLPGTIEESETDLCRSCRTRLEDHQQRRTAVVATLKRVTTRRAIDWTCRVRETRRACDWCGAHERTTHRGLEATVCPVCRRLFETPLGEPDQQPEADRLPDTPTERVEPIVRGTTLPEYDPTALEGSNRPLLTYHERSMYADLVVELERTGHAFDADALAAFEGVWQTYADSVADDPDHSTDVTLEIGRTPRTVTIAGILPADHRDVIEDCREIASDPTGWVPIGWPQQGYIHRRGVDPAVPGSKPVTEAFPQLARKQRSTAVETESLRSATDPGRYERGMQYYERGAVTDLERVDDVLEATVQGSRPYDVQVTLSNGSYVDGRCSCPDDAATCKHVVAAVLASDEVEATGTDRALEAVLASASADELRELLAALADDDLTVRKRIYDEL